MARTHANALATEVVQNRMAQRHHLSKALAVSLMKNQYSNKGFCRGKGRPFDLDDFLVLKLFPGDPILDIFGPPEFLLLGGAVFFNRWTGLRTCIAILPLKMFMG